MLSNVYDLLLDYINLFHVILMLAYGYAAYTFLRDWLGGHNGINKALFFLTAAVASAHLWSVLLLTVWGTGLQASFWRSIQVTFEGFAWLVLVREHIRIRREPKQEDNAKYQNEGHQP